MAKRRTALIDAHKYLDAHEDELRKELSPYYVFNRLKSIPINHNSKPSLESSRQTDRIFVQLKLSGYKLEAKRSHWRLLYQHAMRAHQQGAYLRLSRDMNRSNVSRASLQVIDAAVAAGYLIEHRAKPWSPKMSRYIPSATLATHTTRDPGAFDPNTMTGLVVVRDRETKKPIPFDPGHPVAVDVQRRLELVNSVNSRFLITFKVWDEFHEEFVSVRRLRQIHFASFTNDFTMHGRLYCRGHSHQSLLKLERPTTHFDGERSVELDFSGMHTRLLYHLEGLEYPGDPYELWANTTSEMRLLAKVFLNALINAKTPEQAVKAANNAMSSRTKSGKRKTGKTLWDALRLYLAYKSTGVKFEEMVPLVLELHRPIAHLFGADRGVHLMRIDSAIALDILHRFARAGEPCLSVHDSFIVPHLQQSKLESVMRQAYHDLVLKLRRESLTPGRVHFYPVIKSPPTVQNKG
jgi:hypothetical protein